MVVRRCCLDLRRAPLPLFSSSADEQAHALSEARVDEDPRQVAEARELEAAVAEFTAGLAPDWRAFFELHFVQGLDYAEVSAALGVGKLRCKYMKKVLAARARRSAGLWAALGRQARSGHAS